MNLQKEIEKLRSVYDELIKKKYALECKIETRENTFNDRSEKWQESDKGIEYEEKTQELQDTFDNFDVELENLDSLINELNSLSDGNFDNMS